MFSTAKCKSPVGELDKLNEKKESVLRKKLMQLGISEKEKQDRIITELDSLANLVIDNFIETKNETAKRSS